MTTHDQAAATRRGPRSLPTEVGAVIVTYNSATEIEGCLDAVNSALGQFRRAQVIVVDNDSADATVALASARRDTEVVSLATNGGYAVGVNAGLARLGDVDAVLVLNPDCRPAPDAFLRLAEAMADPVVGIAVPRFVDRDGHTQLTLFRHPTVLRAAGDAVLGTARAGRFARYSEHVTVADDYDRSHAVDWATGAAWMVSRACLETVGRWDESYFLYSEETDYAQRAAAAGFVVRYVPEAVCVHEGGESTVSPRLWSILTLNRVRLYRRRHGRAATALFAGAVALNELLRVHRSEVHRSALRALLRASHRGLDRGLDELVRGGAA